MSPDVHTPDRLSLAAHGARPRSGEGTRIPTCAEGAARRRAEPYTDGQYHDSGGGVPGYVEFPEIGKAVTRHPLRHAYVPEDAAVSPGSEYDLTGQGEAIRIVGSATSANFITYSFDHLCLRYLALLVHFRYPGQAAIIEIDAQFCTTLHNNP